MNDKEREEWVRNKARDHVGYGWSKRPGSHTMDWTDEDTRIYNEEYDLQMRRKKVKDKHAG